MCDRFPKHGKDNNNNMKRSNDNCNDRSQRDFSGPPQKRKLDDLIAPIERPPRGRKTTTMQEQFEKLLQKQCPWHSGAMHLAVECYHLRRTFNAPPLDNKNKAKDKPKEDKNQEDNLDDTKFQEASKTVNMIFGGDSDFNPKWAQKLMLMDIYLLNMRYHTHFGGRRSSFPFQGTINGPVYLS